MHVLIRLTMNLVHEFVQVTALQSTFVQATHVTNLIEPKQNRSESIEK